MAVDAEKEALEYHASNPPGKLYTGLTKPLENQKDLTLAYSPGVAGPCREIDKDEANSFVYTGRGNLVGVVTNGTAVLGLGNIGPAAAKPVMEGKACLFKKYADIDVFDIELDCKSSDEFIAAVRALEPTFGGINLEDIRAPECFYIEETLKEQMSIPVFHDDQHGTAIIAGSAFLNALEITERNIEDVKIVFSGAGAAAIGCASLFLELGVRNENLILCDSLGVIYKGREERMNEYKARFAVDTSLRTLEEALDGADAFLGVSVAGILTDTMIKKMAKNPIIFAMANPDPEIKPEDALAARPDAIIATGRSDYPNQVNNVLGFPFIFRGALDVSATHVNKEMKLAAVRAIADLAKENVPDVVMAAYGKDEGYQFGRDYLIPKPVDPRVLLHVAPAVAKAAMETGAARRKVNLDEYCEKIERILGPTKQLMQKIKHEIRKTSSATEKPHVVFPHGNDPRILRAIAQLYYDGDMKVSILGPREPLLKMASGLGIRDFEKMASFVEPAHDERYDAFVEELFSLRQRKGVTRVGAQQLMLNYDYFAAMMVRSKHADGMLGGIVQPYADSVRPVLEVVGGDRSSTLAGIYLMNIGDRLLFFADCTMNVNPDAHTLADIAIATSRLAEKCTNEDIRVAMLSFSSFGVSRDPEATKVRKATELVQEKSPSLDVEGEIQADAAINEALQKKEFPFCALGGAANVLIFPNLSAANISYKLVSNLAGATATGPILVGVNQPANILQRSATVEEIVSMAYLTAHR